MTRPRTTEKCSVPLCGRPYYCKGYCSKHYQAFRYKQRGSPIGTFSRPLYEKAERMNAMLEDVLKMDVAKSVLECPYCGATEYSMVPIGDCEPFRFNHTQDCIFTRIREFLYNGTK